MTRDAILELARTSGWTEYSVRQAVEVERLVRFATLVAATEREACAQLASAPTAEMLKAALDAWFNSTGSTATESMRAALVAALAQAPQITHSDECWRWHHKCAIAKIERECK